MSFTRMTTNRRTPMSMEMGKPDLTVISNRGMKKRDLSVALAIVQANKRLFIEKWESIHG